ncbi:MAG: hypothetical protein UZ14_CFX002002389 [Chloroflexi bacterium OLB14]|nr:MAG: hypothetical protein UZ14_CFX002002389 [Chloroflexi bacterium OLB14]
MLFIKPLIYQTLNVRASPDFPLAIPAIHIVAAHLSADTIFSEEQIKLIEPIRPVIDKWSYTCYDSAPTLYNPSTHLEAITNKSKELYIIALQLTLKSPRVTISHYMCVTSLLWKIWDTNAHVMIGPLLYSDNSIVPNQIGLENISKLPILKEFLLNLIQKSVDDSVIWLIWRPAIYLYIFLSATIVLMIKDKKFNRILIATPIFLHTTILLLAIVGQDFRFQYSAYLVGLLFIPLFTINYKTATSQPACTLKTKINHHMITKHSDNRDTN